MLFVLVNYNSHAQVSYYEHSGCFDYEHMLMLGCAHIRGIRGSE